MSVSSGSRLGPYVLGERTTPSDSGEWFAATDSTLERPVSVLVAPLPRDEVAAEELRERVRRIAAVSDARLLPVYGQGEEQEAVWLATRHIAGRALPEAGLQRERAARLGAQLAVQLAAMEEGAIAPDRVLAEDLVLEGVGEHERAWLLPNPGRAGGGHVSTATQSLIELLENRVGQRLVEQPSLEPNALADQLAQLHTRRPRRRLALVAAAAALAGALAAVLAAVVLTRDEGSADANTPVASTAARIPLGERIGALSAGADAVWAATPSGALIRVDPKTETVVGAPLKVFPKDAYVDLVTDEGAVWAGGPGLLLRLDSSTGRVVSRRRLGARDVSGVLPTDETLWITLSGRSPIAELVKLDRDTGHELEIGVAGEYAIPAAAAGETVWALGGDASLRRLVAGREPRTIGLGGQAGFPVEHAQRLWIPTRHDQTIVAVDPRTMSIERTLRLDAEAVTATAGAGSVWVLTRNPSQVHRIDPEAGAFVGLPLAAPDGASVLEFGSDSLWVDDPNTKSLIRLTPTNPAPPARPVQATDDVLRNGPVRENVRLRVTTFEPNFSIQVTSDDWLAQALSLGGAGNLELFRYRQPGHNSVGVNFAVTSRAFGPLRRLVPARTPKQFLQVLRRNPSLRIESVEPAKLGSRRGIKVRFKTVPKPPFPQLCGNPCVLLFPVANGTFVLSPGTEEFTIVREGDGVFIVDATYGDRTDPKIAQEIDRLLNSIRFEQ